MMTMTTQETEKSTMTKESEKSNCIMKCDTSVEKGHTLEVEHLMQQIFEGNYLLLPLFAQTLISFLYEEMPRSDNPRILGHHIATRGMHILKTAYDMSKEQEEKEQKEKEQQKLQIQNKPSANIYIRDFTLLLSGLLIGSRHFKSALSLIFILYKMCKDYNKLHYLNKYNSLIEFVCITIFAYLFYC